MQKEENIIMFWCKFSCNLSEFDAVSFRAFPPNEDTARERQYFLFLPLFSLISDLFVVISKP